MDNDTLETNLNSLKEMVLDEEKLVTYRTLSKDLCIHVNDSKKLLLNFVQNIRKNEPDLGLNVNYIICGLSEDNKARTTLSSENDLDNVRKLLKTVFFEHIYCVSKGVPSVDKVALLAVSQFDELSLCTGLIKSNFCIKRSAEEISKLKSNSQVTVHTEKKPDPPKKIKEEVRILPKNDDESKTVTKMLHTQSEPSIKSEAPSPKKDLVSSKTKPDTKKNGVKTQKGIAGFFGKSNSAPSKVLSKTTDDKQENSNKNGKNMLSNVKPSVKTEKMDVDDEVISPVEVVKDTNSKIEVKKEELNGKPKNKANNKLNQIKKNAKVDKKRKRVLHVSDSESDGEKDPFVDENEQQEDNISEDEIPPTPTINTVKITSGIVNPKKRRKVVDKTYTDEDGYILTKKEEVYESCSDNEEVISAKENVKKSPINQIKQEISPKDKKTGPKSSKKKIASPQKGKQPTMMNFFKKV